MKQNKFDNSKDYTFPILDQDVARQVWETVREQMGKHRLPGIVALKDRDQSPFSVVVSVKPSFFHRHPENAIRKLIQKIYVRLANEELKRERQKRLSLLAFL